MENSKYFYCFVGQVNTTFGKPHKVTGRHNLHGDLVAFTSRAKRDKFYNEYYCTNGSINTYKTNKRDAKVDYFGGLSQREFDEYLFYIDHQVDEKYNNYFN
jgi:hypothetical protein